MNKTINAVGFELEQKQSDMIEKKLKRLDYAEDLIIDLILRVKHDKQYSFDTTVNFRWGAQAHVSGEDYDFAAALNKMMDVLDNKINKEKEKVQQKGWYFRFWISIGGKQLFLNDAQNARQGGETPCEFCGVNFKHSLEFSAIDFLKFLDYAPNRVGHAPDFGANRTCDEKLN